MDKTEKKMIKLREMKIKDLEEEINLYKMEISVIKEKKMIKLREMKIKDLEEEINLYKMEISVIKEKQIKYEV